MSQSAEENAEDEAEEAAPPKAAQEEEEEVGPRGRKAIQVADSDAESDGVPAPPLRDSDDEPLASAVPRRRKHGTEKKKPTPKEKATRKKEATPKKRPSASQPKRRVRGKKVGSSASGVDVD